MIPNRASVVSRLRASLLGGADVQDAAFDGLLPEELRHESATHWTPASACRLAAQWLAPTAQAQVLDVGAGVGKLCLIGALATGARFTGVELRPELVRVARGLAAELPAPSASFVCGDALALDWGAYTGVYLYNPFGDALDDGRVRARLLDLAQGARVVVYHALGCAFPEGFQRARREFRGHSPLELWVRGEGATR